MTLSEYLTQADLKPTQFAGRLGVPASTITRIISGDRFPSLHTLHKIEEATGGKVTAQDFFGSILPAPIPEEGRAA